MQKLLTLLFLSSVCFARSNAQVSVTGLTCAIKGVPYQYIISGADSSGPVQVCITGGKIAGTDDSCTTGTAITQVLVIWNDNAATGAVTVTFQSNTQTLNITISQPLYAGKIDSSTLVQTIDSASVPLAINCSPASGGACSPSFTYQWQQSDDNVAWLDIANATDQNLSIIDSLVQNKFYRRKVVETVSGSFSFSDIAAVFIKTIATAGIQSLSAPGNRLAIMQITRKYPAIAASSINFLNLISRQP